MTHRHFKLEGFLYALAFLLALGLRLTQLGAMPLTDVEAAPALQALHIAQGLKPALSPHPLYILSTSVLFFLFGGGTNFLARLVPALAGSALVFAPLLLGRITLRARPSLILAFFIALDPGLTAISRHSCNYISHLFMGILQ
jgi:predicted membrane-bound mannosyltransferase